MGFFKKSNTKKENNSCCCGDIEGLILKEDQKELKSSCGCAEGCTCNEQEIKSDRLIIKVLGSGCKNCITLTENVHKALEEMKLSAEIVKVTDFAQITGYGIMSTPALVLNEKVISYGKVLKPAKIVKLLEKYAAE